ncbi:hypothetical protein ACFQJ8_07095 [Halocatena marina]|uniref:hypothetical protein n=1 Tax=Halocatena marina TaxID=2934937 RepID=UPI003612F530
MNDETNANKHEHETTSDHRIGECDKRKSTKYHEHTDDTATAEFVDHTTRTNEIRIKPEKRLGEIPELP